ncbi:hypothetical protein BJ965_007392 [Streptomyces luteogriseus]|uniref:Membrane transport protein MMPL domain-containing protein n=1 Tax=Streptomyces luteogriseus TaxID=68233 RepID=A0A7W7DWX8_9ACTN|nr:hypothetical protein [Streptomyces luteogriseus]
MSPLARWCHRHRLAVVLAWVGLLIALGGAVGAAITVVLTVLAAITLLPALLGMIGPRILGRAERRALAGLGGVPSGGTGRWGRLAERVQARPKVLGLVGLVVLVALALPTLSLRLGASDDGNLPASSTNRQAYDMIADGFGPGFNGPLVLAVQAPDTDGKAAAARLVTALEQVDGVAGAGAQPLSHPACPPRRHPGRGRRQRRHLPETRRLPPRQAGRRRPAARPLRNAGRHPQGRQAAEGLRAHGRPDHREHPRPASRAAGGPAPGRRPDRAGRRERRRGCAAHRAAAQPAGR